MLGLVWLEVRSLLGKYWKPLALVAALGVAWWGFTSWRDARDAAFEKKGFAAAEQQYKVAVEAANKVTANDNQTMQVFSMAFDALSKQRTQAIDLKVQPQLERIQSEVASDPRYRDCRVSDGVLDSANTARSAVDADIRASAPR